MNAQPAWLSLGARVWFNTTWFHIAAIEADGRVVLAYKRRIWRGFTDSETRAAIERGTLRPFTEEPR